MRKDPRTTEQPIESGKDSRALMAGEEEPVPENVCYGGMRTR
jgi:hypothetical protein